MSVDFEPVKLGPPPRRVDPVRVVVVTVLVAFALAIAKPWTPTVGPDRPVASTAVVPPSLSSSPRPTSVPTSRAVRTTDSTGIPAPTWAELAAVIEPRDRLGVRAIVVARRPSVGSPADPRFEERWAEAVRDLGGGDTAYISRDEQSIVALGLTAPADAVPLDVRIWRLHAGDELEWIDTRPLAPGDPVGAFTFTQAGAARSTTPAWAAGHYRMDVLAEDGIHRIAVEIPGRFGNVPLPEVWEPAQSNVVGPERSDPSGVQIGPFATVDGIGLSLAVDQRDVMSDEEAWRAAIGLEAIGRGPSVASVFLPRATGLGVMLTSHAAVDLAIVQRIAPDARFRAGPMIGGVSEMRGRTPWIAFAPSGGGVWPPGVYAITVQWTDPAGFHAATWHLELRPGPARDRVLLG